MTAESFLEIARRTGVEIVREGARLVWRGECAGSVKPRGPLVGRRVGLLVASEFSDFQAYHLALLLSELGAAVEFLAVDWVKWKHTRPTLKDKGVQGMWGVSLDPIPTLGAARHSYKVLRDARPGDYAGAIVLGGHSADILMTTPEALDLLRGVYRAGGVVGAIGAGSLPLIAAGLLAGRRCTGNRVVAYLLRRIARFEEAPVVADERIVTAADTVDTPAFVREFARAFDPDFEDPRRGLLASRRLLIVAGEDFEDIELVVPVMEMLYAGASVSLATFTAPLRSRPPLVGLDVVQGNFGVSVPLQEIPEDRYRIVRLAQVRMEDFDAVMIPGAFCPWNMVEAAEPIVWLRRAYEAGKILAAICHGPIPLAAADVVADRKLAGVAACREHIAIMGGVHDPDCSAVVDGPIVTGRVPRDVPEFLDAIAYALLAGSP